MRRTIDEEISKIARRVFGIKLNQDCIFNVGRDYKMICVDSLRELAPADFDLRVLKIKDHRITARTTKYGFDYELPLRGIFVNTDNNPRYTEFFSNEDAAGQLWICVANPEVTAKEAFEILIYGQEVYN